MQRRDFLTGAVAMLPLAAQAAPAELNPLPAIRWRLASSFPKSLHPIYGASETPSQRLTARPQQPGWSAGGGLAALRTLYARYNVMQSPGGNTGPQMGGWFRQPIKS